MAFARGVRARVRDPGRLVCVHKRCGQRCGPEKALEILRPSAGNIRLVPSRHNDIGHRCDVQHRHFDRWWICGNFHFGRRNQSISDGGSCGRIKLTCLARDTRRLLISRQRCLERERCLAGKESTVAADRSYETRVSVR